MATPFNRRLEHPSTYPVEDRFHPEESTRLQIQDRMITSSMGGVLPEQADPTLFQNVLDVGCGTGGWLIEVAQTYPTIKRLAGIDISERMCNLARAQARAEQVEDRVEFQVMDALRLLEFPAGTFDLINLRFGVSWLRTWDWPKLLLEFRRVARPDGTIRLTESDMLLDQTSSPALKQLSQLFFDALYQSGHLFAHNKKDGVLPHLPRLLHQYGMQNIHEQPCQLTYRAGTPAGQQLLENAKRGFQTGQPFIQKWTRVPSNYAEIYQQMVDEMQQPDFVALWEQATAWGTTPL